MPKKNAHGRSITSFVGLRFADSSASFATLGNEIFVVGAHAGQDAKVNRRGYEDHYGPQLGCCSGFKMGPSHSESRAR
jgi:hypothetical protein